MVKFHKVLEKIALHLEKLIQLVLVLTLSTLFICVVLGVFTRNINFPIIWLGELGTFSSIWAVFFGMCLAYRKNQFPNVDIINYFVPASCMKYLSIFYDVVIFIFLTVTLWSSRIFITHLLTSGQISPELRLPMAYAYLGPIFGYTFTGYFCLVSIVKKSIC